MTLSDFLLPVGSFSKTFRESARLLISSAGLFLEEPNRGMVPQAQYTENIKKSF